MAIAGALPRDRPSDRRPDPLDLFRAVEARLPALLPAARAGENDVLFHSAAAGLLGRGKRARPILSMLASHYAGGDAVAALDFGCAVETVHAASLVLDDLPCMDDASLRRGAPALHLSHGEDAAVLVSIALLNQAHRTVLSMDLDAERRLALIGELTGAVGFDGLAQGQMRDLRDGADTRTEGDLRRLNDLKTGALIVAALRGGGLIGGADAARLDALTRFGACIGFAFQLCDDLNDVQSTTETLGKDVGQDRDKLTFVDLWGPGRVQAAIRQAVDRAQDALGGPTPLGDYVRGLLLNAAGER